MDRIDCIVAGAGLVGLAVARDLAQRGLEVLILEAADAIGTETSSRNSEVIHAGIYYEPGSLKARLCVEGKERLYAYAAEKGVPHRRCGKLIVATDPAQLPVLEAIKARAAASGVNDLELIPAEAAIEMEPALRCTGALISPSTGIVDSHALMLAYLGDAENAGAMLSLNTEIVSGRIDGAGFRAPDARPRDGRDFRNRRPQPGQRRRPRRQCARHSARGLSAERTVPPLHYARGCYFSVTGKRAFSRLIYPVPEPGGLGVHLTLDLSGSMRFGPDVEWIQAKDCTVNSRARRPFLRRNPQILAGCRRRQPEPHLQRHPPKTVGAGRARGRLHDPGTRRPWPGRAGQSVRHRKPRPDQFAGNRGSRRSFAVQGLMYPF